MGSYNKPSRTQTRIEKKDIIVPDLEHLALEEARQTLKKKVKGELDTVKTIVSGPSTKTREHQLTVENAISGEHIIDTELDLFLIPIEGGGTVVYELTADGAKGAYIGTSREAIYEETPVAVPEEVDVVETPEQRQLKIHKNSIIVAIQGHRWSIGARGDGVSTRMTAALLEPGWMDPNIDETQFFKAAQEIYKDITGGETLTLEQLAEINPALMEGAVDMPHFADGFKSKYTTPILHSGVKLKGIGKDVTLKSILSEGMLKEFDEADMKMIWVYDKTSKGGSGRKNGIHAISWNPSLDAGANLVYQDNISVRAIINTGDMLFPTEAHATAFQNEENGLPAKSTPPASGAAGLFRWNPDSEKEFGLKEPVEVAGPVPSEELSEPKRKPITPITAAPELGKGRIKIPEPSPSIYTQSETNIVDPEVDLKTLSEISFEVQDKNLRRTIIDKTWERECGKSISGLTSWNKGEPFPSLAFAHFIWFPESLKKEIKEDLAAGKANKYNFEESFPPMMNYLQKQGVEFPESLSWMFEDEELIECKWKTKEEFNTAKNNGEFTALQNFFADPEIQDVQLDYIIKGRVEGVKNHIAEDLKLHPYLQQTVIENFELLSQTSEGKRVFIDYANYKGTGTDPEKDYYVTKDGEKIQWGLYQVLLHMEPSNNNPLQAVENFADAAYLVLINRRLTEKGEDGTNGPNTNYVNGFTGRIDGYSPGHMKDGLDIASDPRKNKERTFKKIDWRDTPEGMARWDSTLKARQHPESFDPSQLIESKYITNVGSNQATFTAEVKDPRLSEIVPWGLEFNIIKNGKKTPTKWEWCEDEKKMEYCNNGKRVKIEKGDKIEALGVQGVREKLIAGKTYELPKESHMGPETVPDLTNEPISPDTIHLMTLFPKQYHFGVVYLSKLVHARGKNLSVNDTFAIPDIASNTIAKYHPTRKPSIKIETGGTSKLGIGNISREYVGGTALGVFQIGDIKYPGGSRSASFTPGSKTVLGCNMELRGLSGKEVHEESYDYEFKYASETASKRDPGNKIREKLDEIHNFRTSMPNSNARSTNNPVTKKDDARGTSWHGMAGGRADKLDNGDCSSASGGCVVQRINQVSDFAEEVVAVRKFGANAYVSIQYDGDHSSQLIKELSIDQGEGKESLSYSYEDILQAQAENKEFVSWQYDFLTEGDQDNRFEKNNEKWCNDIEREMHKDGSVKFLFCKKSELEKLVVDKHLRTKLEMLYPGEKIIFRDIDARKNSGSGNAPSEAKHFGIHMSAINTKSNTYEERALGDLETFHNSTMYGGYTFQNGLNLTRISSFHSSLGGGKGTVNGSNPVEGKESPDQRYSGHEFSNGYDQDGREWGLLKDGTELTFINFEGEYAKYSKHLHRYQLPSTQMQEGMTEQLEVANERMRRKMNKKEPGRYPLGSWVLEVTHSYALMNSPSTKVSGQGAHSDFFTLSKEATEFVRIEPRDNTGYTEDFRKEAKELLSGEQPTVEQLDEIAELQLDMIKVREMWLSPIRKAIENTTGQVASFDIEDMVVHTDRMPKPKTEGRPNLTKVSKEDTDADVFDTALIGEMAGAVDRYMLQKEHFDVDPKTGVMTVKDNIGDKHLGDILQRYPGMLLEAHGEVANIEFVRKIDDPERYKEEVGKDSGRDGEFVYAGKEEIPSYHKEKYSQDDMRVRVSAGAKIYINQAHYDLVHSKE